MAERQSILPNPIAEDDEISFKELILKTREVGKNILSQWIIIVFAGFLGGTIGLAYAYSKKPVYTAELSFALEDEGSGGGIGGALGLASQFGFDVGGSGGGAFAADNLVQLMKSRTIVEKTLLSTIEYTGKETTLAEVYLDYNKLHEAWAGKPNLQNLHYIPNADRNKFTLQQDSVLGVIHKTLIASYLSVDKLDKKSSIILIRFNSENEFFAKYFTDILAKEVSGFYVETKTKKSAHNLTILQHQTDSVRHALNSAMGGVASSADANPNANAARQILRVPSLRRQVDVQTNQAILIELVKNLEISKVALRKETPLIQVIDRPILPLKKEKVGRLGSTIIGGFLTGFVTVIFLMTRYFWRQLMA